MVSKEAANREMQKGQVYLATFKLLWGGRVTAVCGARSSGFARCCFSQEALPKVREVVGNDYGEGSVDRNEGH